MSGDDVIFTTSELLGGEDQGTPATTPVSSDFFTGLQFPTADGASGSGTSGVPAAAATGDGGTPYFLFEEGSPHPVGIAAQPDDWAAIAWRGPEARAGQRVTYQAAATEPLDREVLVLEPEHHRATGGRPATVPGVSTTDLYFTHNSRHRMLLGFICFTQISLCLLQDDLPIT